MKEFIVNLKNKLKPIWAAYGKKLIIPILELLGVIILCVVLVHIISGHETLADYAAKHPEIAYPVGE
ncbi:MAG: hypothetical protein ILP13_10495 [Lachnospiraceae bacterium]|nr:hypothetical protein [Lachnospiraceae bacterium]